MQYVLDSVWGAGGVRTFGTETLEIVNLSYPSSVNAGEPFSITYGAQNNSGAPVNAFGYVINTTTNEMHGYWEATITAPGTYNASTTMPGITSTFYGEVRIGHIEGPVTCTNPAGADGDILCGIAGTNAPDPTHQYQCSSTGWIDLGASTNCGYTPPGPGINWMMVGAMVAVVSVVGIVFLVGKR